MKSSDRNRFPLIIVISGPSGVGKDVVIDAILDKNPNFHHIVTATTREKRPGEAQGIDYYFLSKKEFKQKIESDEFLEYAEVYGNYYGVLKSEVEKALRQGKDVILKVDVQGATTLKKKIPGALFIFLAPSSLDDLSDRMKNRNADTVEAMKIRIDKAKEEMRKSTLFNYSITNVHDNLAVTVKKVQEYIDRYRRQKPVVKI